MKNLKLILFVFAIAFSFTSCELNDESTIDGHDLTGGSAIVGWANKSVSESYFSDQGVIDKEYPINILGYDNNVFDKDINYTISVVANETTANNNEYILNSTTGTIPAGNDFGNFTIGINTTNFSPNQPTKVTFLIETSTSGSVVSSLSNKMVMEFIGCDSDLGGDYTDAFGTTHTFNQFDNIFYRVPYLPPFNNVYWFEYKDVCGVLTITNWQFQGSNPLTQNAPGFIEDDGTVVFPSVTVADVDWYVNKEIRFIKN